jgi:hypothetical protein
VATNCAGSWRHGKSLTKPHRGFRLSAVSTFSLKRNYSSDPVDCNADVLEYIPKFRAVVYELPRLANHTNEPCPEAPARKRDWERRKEESVLFGKLSRFYRLEEVDSNKDRERKLLWSRGTLLKESEL